MSLIVEKAALTVNGLLERRHHLRTYDERVQHALDLVEMHMETENPERIEECIRLYTEDAEWEAPLRGVTYIGREDIKSMYLKLFAAIDDIVWTPIERFATPDRVVDDMHVAGRLSREGVENSPFPLGTKIKGRLVHNFHIRDGMISKEIGYEVWRRDE